MQLLRKRALWVRGFGLLCAYALALQLVLGGFAGARAFAGLSGTLVLCHTEGAGADAPSAPAQPQAAHVCQLCCLAGGAALDAAAPGLAPPRLIVFAAWERPGTFLAPRPVATGPHSARGPPTLV